jgi:hypothetical protein
MRRIRFAALAALRAALFGLPRVPGVWARGERAVKGFTKPPHYGKKARYSAVLTALVSPLCNRRIALSCGPRSRPACYRLEQPEQPLRTVNPFSKSSRSAASRSQIAPYFDEGDISAPVGPLTALA